MVKLTAAIYDLDGTICDTSHRRHHLLEEVNGKWVKKARPNWKGWEDGLPHDPPKTGVVTIYLSSFDSRDIDVVLSVTGRKEHERAATLAWFDSNNLPRPDFLFMRADNDRRPDTEVKAEIYETLIKPYYDVIYVIEDRARVAAMWRSQGLMCLQCDEGDY